MNFCKLIYLGLLFGFMSGNMQAQPIEVEAIRAMSDNVDHMQKSIQEISSELRYSKKPKKNVYLFFEWAAATVYTKNKEFINCSARYNILKRRMEIKSEGQPRTLNPNLINGIIIEESLFVPLSSIENGVANDFAFYEVIAEGKLSLMYKYDVSLQRTGAAGLYANISSTQEYKSDKSLYYCEISGPPTPFKKGKKHVLPLFGESQKLILVHASKNGLGFRKEKDLIDLFGYYNSLLK